MALGRSQGTIPSAVEPKFGLQPRPWALNMSKTPFQARRRTSMHNGRKPRSSGRRRIAPQKPGVLPVRKERGAREKREEQSRSAIGASSTGPKMEGQETKRARKAPRDDEGTRGVTLGLSDLWGGLEGQRDSRWAQLDPARRRAFLAGPRGCRARVRVFEGPRTIPRAGGHKRKFPRGWAVIRRRLAECRTKPFSLRGWFFFFFYC